MHCEGFPVLTQWTSFYSMKIVQQPYSPLACFNVLKKMRLSYTLLRILKEAIVMQMNNRVSPVSHKFFASLPFFNKCRKCAVCIAAGVLFIGEESALYNKFVRCELFFIIQRIILTRKTKKPHAAAWFVATMN